MPGLFNRVNWQVHTLDRLESFSTGTSGRVILEAPGKHLGNESFIVFIKKVQNCLFQDLNSKCPRQF